MYFWSALLASSALTVALVTTTRTDVVLIGLGALFLIGLTLVPSRIRKAHRKREARAACEEGSGASLGS